MKSLVVKAAACLAACLAASPVLAQSPLSAADQAAIRASADTFVKAVLAKDFAKVASLYTDDAILMPPNQAAVKGRTAIQAWMQAFPETKELAFELVEVDGRGDLAYVHGKVRMVLVPPGAPGPVTDTGKFIEVRRRQTDGTWKIALDIFNSDVAAGH